MAQCTAPVEGHRTASAAANCPACRGGRSYRQSYPTYYGAPPRYAGGSASGSGGSSGRSGPSAGGASRRTRGGTSVSYSSSEWRTVEPLARKAAEQALTYPERRDLVLVTPAMLHTLKGQGIADKELSTLLATDRVIPVAHGTTFEALREISPMLASRSGLDTRESSLADVAAKIAAAAAALTDADG